MTGFGYANRENLIMKMYELVDKLVQSREEEFSEVLGKKN